MHSGKHHISSFPTSSILWVLTAEGATPADVAAGLAVQAVGLPGVWLVALAAGWPRAQALQAVKVASAPACWCNAAEHPCW